jgi:tRNA (guanine-N7-)-methyltransferase
LGKDKLARWAEMKTFGNVIEPPHVEVKSEDHPLKGKWGAEWFKNSKPIVVELGCGKGEYTVGLARRFPDYNFTGVDIKGARIWRGAKTAYESDLKNILFIRTRIEFISRFFAKDEVSEIWITFPDPFPRQRDEARRLTSPLFLNSYRSFIRNKGLVHLKTDNFDLYRYTKGIAEKNSLEIVAATDDLYSSNSDTALHQIRTHYENIFLAEGKKINYLAFRLETEKKLS